MLAFFLTNMTSFQALQGLCSEGAKGRHLCGSTIESIDSLAFYLAQPHEGEASIDHIIFVTLCMI